MNREVHVTAPSRLHFGLMSLGQFGARQYGGVGAMIERPGLELRVSPARYLTCEGRLAERARRFALRWAEFHHTPPPNCRIEVLATPPEHVGLGTGTQLGLAVAAGLAAYVGLPALTAPELALSVGRGLRSAVGTYGFVMGGLIVEQGKLASEPISPLDCRIDLPEAWRFLLVRPLDQAGLSGDDEATAIDALPAIAPETAAQLAAEARDHLIPAAATSDFAAFSASLYRYGHRSGVCFAARQGGPFNGAVLTALVNRIRGLGVEGVGQSSWGPTIFAVLSSQEQAERLRKELASHTDDPALEFVIAPPNNRGATIEVFPSASDAAE
jgi:beta-RFAP synthase